MKAQPELLVRRLVRGVLGTQTPLGFATRAACELLLLLGAYITYSWARNKFGSGAPGDEAGDLAFANAVHVLNFESALGLCFERDLQEMLLENCHALLWFANFYYAIMHLALSVSAFALLFLVRRDGFALVRNAFLLSTLVALVGYCCYPLMPPRLLDTPGSMYGGAERRDALGLPPFGFVDVTHTLCTSAPWHTNRMRVTNNWAAMPSMHAGWALWILLSVWLLVLRPRPHNGGSSRQSPAAELESVQVEVAQDCGGSVEQDTDTRSALHRALLVVVLVHPVLTVVCTIVTANHYWIDAVAGALVMLACFGASYVLRCKLHVSNKLL
eukprot:TRINITY_DN3387_c0_g3_i1.p1 TRINITY_DN3387_c0_g3~~TRINITY_DN3387_c0_g3_i1.p1  ORF type:complete len:328 (-),score=96.64 TRINITY_DN3387_c0_g3_i1:49-1032(-)